MLLLEKLHGRHHNLVNRCEISISQMTMDILLFTYMFSVLYNCQYFDRICLYIWVMRRVSCKKQDIPAIHNHLSSSPVFSGARVTRSLVLYVCFVDSCLSFCTFSFDLCVVCSSSIYGLWLPFGIFTLVLIAIRTAQSGLTRVLF